MEIWFRSLGEGLPGDGGVVLAALFWAVVFLTGVSGLLVITATVLRIRHIRFTRRQGALSERWTPALMDVLAGDARDDVLLNHVRRSDRALFVEFILQYAFTIKGSGREILNRLARPHLGVMKSLSKARNPLKRVRAVQALGALGGAEQAGVVLRALDDASPLVAITAARLLLRQGDSRHARDIIDRLHRFIGWGSSYLSSMLSQFKPDAAPLLLAAFTDQARDVAIRAIVADALRWMNYVPAADAAAEALASETEPELLAAALRLLRRLGRPEHARLVRPFCASENPMLRIHAISALAALGDGSDARYLRAAFDDASHWVAIRAARGLREAGHIDALRELAESENVRAALARQVMDEEG